MNNHGAAMPRLHGETSQVALRVRMRHTLIRFSAILVVAVVGIVMSMIWRDNSHVHNVRETPSLLITIAITLVFGALFLFCWGMKMSPLLAYRRYMREIGRGLSRDVDGVVVRFDEETTFRDGLSFYAMIVNVGDLKNPEDERLLYWDAQLPRPEVHEGDRVRLTAHGNDIIGYE